MQEQRDELLPKCVVWGGGNANASDSERRRGTQVEAIFFLLKCESREISYCQHYVVCGGGNVNVLDSEGRPRCNARAKTGATASSVWFREGE